MAKRLRRAIDIAGARAIAVAAGALATAAIVLAKLGAPSAVVVVLAAVGVVVASAAAVLVVLESSQPWRDRARERVHTGERLGRLGRGRRLIEEEGLFFVGRTRALIEIEDWLEKPRAQSPILVVTGNPGSGKSAVLGRIVAGQQPELVLDCRTQTLEGVAREIADALRLRTVHPDALVDELVLRNARPFVLVFDSLDEAGEHAESIARLLVEIADRCRAGAKLLVGTRRGGPRRQHLRALGVTTRVIDLDSADYFVFDDLVGAIEARLRREPTAPVGYRNDRAFARQVAIAVAERARPSFLVGWASSRELASRTSEVDLKRPAGITSFQGPSRRQWRPNCLHAGSLATARDAERSTFSPLSPSPKAVACRFGLTSG